MEHEDYKKPKKVKPADIKLSAELPDSVECEMSIEEPKRKIHKQAKAKIVEVGKKKTNGGLF
jgi:hypothetical protein